MLACCEEEILLSVGLTEILAVHTAGRNIVQMSFESGRVDEQLHQQNTNGIPNVAVDTHGESASQGRSSIGIGGGVAEELKFECTSSAQLVLELGRRVELARHIARKRTRIRWASFDSRQFQQQVLNALTNTGVMKCVSLRQLACVLKLGACGFAASSKRWL
eukprot:SAG31_NODE_441_length_15661_cov_17.905423_12_plen_162_part_00